MTAKPKRARKAREWWLMVYPDGSGYVTGWRSPKPPGFDGELAKPRIGMSFVRVREVQPRARRKK